MESSSKSVVSRFISKRGAVTGTVFYAEKQEKLFGSVARANGSI